MHGLPNHDPGRQIDWGKTAADYAAYRPGYPASFFRKLAALDIGLPGQRILDLGTGTGVLARQFAAQGCRVVGADIAGNQLSEARRLAAEQKLAVDFVEAPAEDNGLPGGAFDVITASQSWLYFDKARAIPEVLRLLAPGGCLMTCHFCWLPRVDKIARRTEELVLKFNPQWSAANWGGELPAQPDWSREKFRVRTMFYYDEPIPFTREAGGAGFVLAGASARRCRQRKSSGLTRNTPSCWSRPCRSVSRCCIGLTATSSRRSRCNERIAADHR